MPEPAWRPEGLGARAALSVMGATGAARSYAYGVYCRLARSRRLAGLCVHRPFEALDVAASRLLGPVVHPRRRG